MSHAGEGSAGSASCAAVQGPTAPCHPRLTAMTGWPQLISPMELIISSFFWWQLLRHQPAEPRKALC